MPSQYSSSEGGKGEAQKNHDFEYICDTCMHYIFVLVNMHM